MSKRFTDTDKWKDEWFLSLPNDYKLIWLWMNDNCDFSGILKDGVSLLNLFCKTDINESDLLNMFEGYLLKIEEGYFMPDFLKLQYDKLTSSRAVILSVIKSLNKYNLVDIIKEQFGDDFITIPQPLHNDSGMFKEKAKDKEKDMVKVQKTTQKRVLDKTSLSIPTLDEVKEYCFSRKSPINPQKFIDYYQAIGWKIGNNKMKDWKAAVRVWESREIVKTDSTIEKKPTKFVSPLITRLNDVKTGDFIESPDGLTWEKIDEITLVNITRGILYIKDYPQKYKDFKIIED